MPIAKRDRKKPITFTKLELPGHPVLQEQSQDPAARSIPGVAGAAAAAAVPVQAPPQQVLFARSAPQPTRRRLNPAQQPRISHNPPSWRRESSIDSSGASGPDSRETNDPHRFALKREIDDVEADLAGLREDQVCVNEGELLVSPGYAMYEQKEQLEVLELRVRSAEKHLLSLRRQLRELDRLEGASAASREVSRQPDRGAGPSSDSPHNTRRRPRR